MLYEVITTYRKSIQELESDASRGKAAKLLLARVDAVAGEADRITSYNVCYTKLLREVVRELLEEAGFHPVELPRVESAE